MAEVGEVPMADSQVLMEVGAAMAVAKEPTAAGAITAMVGSIRSHDSYAPTSSRIRPSCGATTCPATDGFIRHLEPALGQQLLDVAVA